MITKSLSLSRLFVSSLQYGLMLTWASWLPVVIITICSGLYLPILSIIVSSGYEIAQPCGSPHNIKHAPPNQSDLSVVF